MVKSMGSNSLHALIFLPLLGVTSLSAMVLKMKHRDIVGNYVRYWLHSKFVVQYGFEIWMAIFNIEMDL